MDSVPLENRKCKPHEELVLLPSNVVNEYLKKVRGWDLAGTNKICKSYSFKDFREALSFTNRVGELAEREGHHPDICLGWGKVELTMWTHSVDGLSENDFILAAKIDGI